MSKAKKSPLSPDRSLNLVGLTGVQPEKPIPCTQVLIMRLNAANTVVVLCALCQSFVNLLHYASFWLDAFA